jgi:tetratricopeptide (TPR) repeat protein
MDIWAWVHDHVEALREEDGELAQQVDALSTWTCDGEHGRVDAALPAIVARLRRLDRPWLEVFARHWGLQSRVLHRQDARRDVLREAVDLVERAHRPDARECPQSVCTTQDLCAAYGVLDGAGYAEARIQAAEEALARIDARWPCYACIHGELASALLDQGRPAEALARADAAEQAMREAGHDGHLALSRTQAFLDLGRYEEALELARTYDNQLQGASGLLAKSVRTANALLHLGRVDEAREVLPDRATLGDEVEEYAEWLDVVLRLVRDHGQPMDDALVRDVNQMLRRLSLHCTHRDTLDAAVAWAGHAVAEGSWAYANAWCGLAEQHLPHLVAPLGADETVATVRAAIEAARPAPLGSDVDAAIAAFHEAIEQEAVSFAALDVTARALPEAEAIVGVTADRWIALGWPEQAHALVAAAMAAHPSPGLVRLRLRTLYDMGDIPTLTALLDEWIDAPDPGVQVTVRWFRSLVAEREGRHEEAAAEMGWIVAHQPDHASDQVPRRQAAMLQKAGDLEGALAVLDALVADDDSTDVHWFRMEIATALERWATVRDSAAAVGVELDGEGMIDDPAGAVQLDIPPHPVWATRIGPCHARVDTITGPGAAELHRSVWAFDPFSGSGDDVKRFQVNRCLAPSTYTAVALDGVRLPDDALAPIRRVAREARGAAYLASGDGYRIVDPDSGAPVPAGWVKVALPTDSAAWPQLRDVFVELASQHRPLVWPELADLLGDTAEAEAHRRLAIDWGM